MVENDLISFCAAGDVPIDQLSIGSLASCPDPNITLEVLNFILSPEVLRFLQFQNSNVLPEHLLRLNKHTRLF